MRVLNSTFVGEGRDVLGRGSLPAILSLGIVAAGLMILRVLLWHAGNDQFDLATAYIPWQSYIIENGRWHALRQPVGMYFPAYYELTAVTSYLDGRISRAAQIKLLSFCFDMVGAVAAYLLAGRLIEATDRHATMRRVIASFTILAGPTVILNGALWGQCDIVYTTFIVLSITALISGAGGLAVLLYGFAFAFKLQAVFVGPFFMAVLLTKRIRIWHVLLFPVGWIVSLVPPLLNGATLSSYLGQFGGQTGAFDRLAIDIGNPWAVAQWLGLSERVGLPIGLVIAAAVGLSIAAWGRNPAFLGPVNTCALAALSAEAMPYFLPKMGNRYFFPAEVLLCILSCADPAFVLPAALILMGSLLSYGQYFLPYDKHLSLFVALLANTWGLWLTFRILRSRVMANSTGTDRLDESAGWQPASAVATSPNHPA